MNERMISISTSTIIKVILIALGLVLLWLVSDILAMIFVALFLAALIQPAADWGVKYKIPRGVMVLVVYFVLFGLTALVIALMVPTLVDQMTRLVNILGLKWGALQNVITSISEFAKTYSLSSTIAPDFSTVQNQLGGAFNGLFGVLASVFGGIAAFIIVLVMSFYLVAQERKALTVVRDFVPLKHQKFAMNLINDVQEKIGQWLRGQLLLSLIIGILYYIGLLIIGVDSPLVLAIFGGLTEFVPYLGPILGGVPIVFVAFVQSPTTGVFALILLVIIQQAENHLIVPKVMQKAVGLNPLVSIISMLVGAKLFGIMGALLAIPVATALSVIIKEVRNYWPNKID
ncbi:MAG: AI-2E family transporter [Patescibacteria group bacterium]|nr:AI-2E family transporter [Patescibacteria group bacterium]